MLHLLSVENTAFTFVGYAVSYIELIGTILYLWSVWLIARRHIWTWPVGIVSVLLYMVLFYQIRLYADAGEQIYYLIASAIGWWRWSQVKPENGKAIGVCYSSPRQIAFCAVVTLIVSLIVAALLRDVHAWWPIVFPEPASFPMLDALTTMMSFMAMALMVQKRVESWVYWIIVDIIGIGLYYVKGVPFVALLYVVLLFMAVNGLSLWHRNAWHRNATAETAAAGAT